jgi:hypothetical protein
MPFAAGELPVEFPSWQLQSEHFRLFGQHFRPTVNKVERRRKS